jgi:hypothetical protein
MSNKTRLILQCSTKRHMRLHEAPKVAALALAIFSDVLQIKPTLLVSQHRNQQGQVQPRSLPCAVSHAVLQYTLPTEMSLDLSAIKANLHVQ